MLSRYSIVLAWLHTPKDFRSILISLQYYVWVCCIFLDFLCPNFVRPISELREWLRTMTLKSALVDGHLSAQCLVCLQPAQRDSRPNICDWLWQIQSGTGQISDINFNRQPPSSDSLCKWNDVRESGRTRLASLTDNQRTRIRMTFYYILLYTRVQLLCLVPQQPHSSNNTR